MTVFLFFASVFMVYDLFKSPCVAMEERPKIAFPQLVLNSSDSFINQQSLDNQPSNNSPYCPYLNMQPRESQYPPAEPEDLDYYETKWSNRSTIDSSGSHSNSPYINFPPVPSYSPTPDRSDYNLNHYLPSQAIISPMDTNQQLQLQQYHCNEMASSPQYIVMEREDLKKLLEGIIEQKNQEQKQMLEALLTQTDKNRDVLTQIELGQEHLVGQVEELKGKYERIYHQLTNPHQSMVLKLYNWGNFLFKAGTSIATSATVYTAITPILSIIAPPAIPILTGFSGLYMFSKLV